MGAIAAGRPGHLGQDGIQLRRIVDVGGGYLGAADQPSLLIRRDVRLGPLHGHTGLRRLASINGSSMAHCAFDSIAPPTQARQNANKAQPFKRQQAVGVWSWNVV